MATITRSVVHDDHLIDPEGVTPVAGNPSRAARAFAATRIGIGLVFLWAFVDKLFALGFTTGRLEDGTIAVMGDAAWLNGGSPTFGFLEFGTAGPFAAFFQSFAGAGWADWVFMLGLLGIGLGLTLGVAMRLSTFAGATMLMLMWAAALPPEHHPFLDDHVIYSLALVGLYYAASDRTWGLGTWWEDRVGSRVPALR